MITTKEQLKHYIEVDRKANGRKNIYAKMFGDEIWKFQISMRKLDYYKYRIKDNPLYIPLCMIYAFKFHFLSIKLGYTIPYNVCEEGLSLVHYGTIVISPAAHIGKNCRIQECVNIGATSGSDKAPQIGNNVFIGTGAKVIGDISIADNVCIGAGAVVVKSIDEDGATYAGVPARKISNNSSKSNLSSMLFK